MQVLKLTDSPKVDTAALKACIENDPALTAKILRVVNSSMFGLSREVVDLNQALAMLGIKPLKLLVLGFSLPEDLFRQQDRRQLERYWRRSLTRALAAREIGETLWNGAGDEAFIAGLLYDIGMLVLLADLGDAYSNFLDGVEAEGADQEMLEAKSLGFSYRIVSASVLDRWGLPKSLVEAIATPKSLVRLCGLTGKEAMLPQILHLADLLTQLATQHRIGLLPELLEAGRNYCDMTNEQLTNLVSTLPKKIEQLADVLSLEPPRGLDYRDVLAQAHGLLATAAAEAAVDLFQREQADHQPYQKLLEETQALAKQATAFAGRASEPAATSDSITLPMGPPTVDASSTTVMMRIPPGSASATLDSTLLARVEKAARDCRASRCELSLLVAELDPHQPEGALDAEHARQGYAWIVAAGRSIDHPEMTFLEVGDGLCAMLLPDCDRWLAVQYGRELAQKIETASAHAMGHNAKTTLSVGVATVSVPPKNFSPEKLIDGARRCLFGAQASGGASVKSIEIY